MSKRTTSPPAMPSGGGGCAVPAKTWVPPVAAAVVTCLAVSSVYMTQPVFPQIASSLHVGVIDARFAFFVASLAYALAFFVFGPLSDRYQARALAAGGAVTLSACVVGAAYVGSFAVFELLLAAAGIAAAAVPAGMFALMPRIAPPGRLGSYFGMIIGATVAGITLGRSFAGVVAGWLSWQQAFVGLAALNVAGLALLLLVPGTPVSSGADRVPILPSYLRALRMLGTSQVTRLLFIGILLFFGYLGVVTFLTFRLVQPPFRYDAVAVGAVSLVGLVGVLGAPISGAVTSRVGARTVVLASLGAAAGGMLALAVSHTTALVVVGLLLLFLGVFCCQPAVLVLLAAAVPAAQRGTASSSYLLCCLCAGSASSAALGPVWSGGGWHAIVVVGLSAVALAALLTTVVGRPGTGTEARHG